MDQEPQDHETQDASEPQELEVPVQVEFETRLPFLKQKFFFHEKIKESPHSKHFAVEDITTEDPQVRVLLYLRQFLCRSREEYEYSIAYYQKIKAYCASQFSKNDIIRVLSVHFTEEESEGYYELVVLFEYGEADRIDVERIEKQHIHKFLKNITVLLADVKKSDIYHSNIKIENIVLILSDLKLSGFKPLFIKNPDVEPWKKELIEQFSFSRLDLFLIGVLWLRFLGENLLEVIKGKSLEEALAYCLAACTKFSRDTGVEIVQSLLDLKQFPDFSFDDLQKEFDEFLVIENKDMIQAEKDSVELPPQDTLSVGEHSMKKSESKDTNNIFMKQFRESEKDLLSRQEDRERERSRDREESLLRGEGNDFTLREDNSAGRPDREELITIQDGGHQVGVSFANDSFEALPNQLKPGTEARMSEAIPGQLLSSARVFSEKQLLNPDSKKELDVANLRKGLSSKHIDSQQKMSIGSKASSNRAIGSLRHTPAAPEPLTPPIPESEAPAPTPRKSTPTRRESRPEARNSTQKRESSSKVEPRKSVPKKEEAPEAPRRSSATKTVKTVVAKRESEVKKTTRVSESKRTSTPKTLVISEQHEEEHNLSGLKESDTPVVKGILSSKKIEDENEDLKEEEREQEEVKEVKEYQNQSDSLGETKLKQLEEGLLESDPKEHHEEHHEEHYEEHLEDHHENYHEDQHEEHHEGHHEEHHEHEESKELRESKNLRGSKGPKSLKESKVLGESQDRKEPTTPKVRKTTPSRKKKPRLDQSVEEVQPRPLSAAEEAALREELEARRAEDLRRRKAEVERKTAERERRNRAIREKIEARLRENAERFPTDRLEPNRPAHRDIFSHSQEPSEVHFKAEPTSFKPAEPKKQGFKRDPIEELDKRMKSATQLSHPLEREKLFQYNAHDKNLNVPFIRALEKATEGKAVPLIDSALKDENLKSSGAPEAQAGESKPATSRGAPKTPKSPAGRSESPRKAGEPEGVFASDGDMNSSWYEKRYKSISDPFSLDKSLPNAAALRPDGSDPGINTPEYQAHLLKVKQLIIEKKYQEGLDYLFDCLDSFYGQQHLENLRLLSIIYFKMKNFAESERNLTLAIDYLHKHLWLPHRDETKRSFYINLAIVYLESEKFEESLRLLNDAVFRDSAPLPFSYYCLLGDALQGLKFPREAYENYHQHLRRLLQTRLGEFGLAAVLLTVNKAANALCEINDAEEFVGFLASLVESLKAVRAVHEALPPRMDLPGFEADQQRNESVDAESPGLSEALRAVVETAVHNVSFLLSLRRNFDFLEQLFELVIDRGVINPSLLSGSSRAQLGQHALQTALNLRRQPHFASKRALFAKLLDFASGLLRSADPSDQKSIKLALLALFNRGVLHLEGGEFAPAEKVFADCLGLHRSAFPGPHPSLAEVLFNIGLTLNAQGKPQYAIFYLQKAEELAIPESALALKAAAKLGKLYFKKGDTTSCRKVMREWLRKAMKQRPKPKGVFKNLSMYFLCCPRGATEEFDETLRGVEGQSPQADSLSKIALAYRGIFQGLARVSHAPRDYAEIEKHLERLQAIFRAKDEPGLNKKLLEAANAIHARYVLNRRTESDCPDLVSMVAEDHLTPEENASMAHELLFNFLFLAVHKLPAQDDARFGAEFTRKALEALKRFKKDPRLTDAIVDSLKRPTPPVLPESLKTNQPHFYSKVINEPRTPPRTLAASEPIGPESLSFAAEAAQRLRLLPETQMSRVLNHSPLPSQKTNEKEQLLSSQNELYREIMAKEVKEDPPIAVDRPSAKVKRAPSDDFARRSNYAHKAKCACFEPNRKKFEIVKLVEEFLRQVKNMIFLGVSGKLEEYFSRFEAIVREKRLNWEKFVYVRKIVRFYLAAKETESVDRAKLTGLFESIVSDPSLCIHDFKMIIQLLEAFKNAGFVEELVIFLAREHPNIASVVFPELFFGAFERKFRKARVGILGKVLTGRFYALENFPLLHHLAPERLQAVDKELSFRLHNRYRFDAMANPKLRPLFAQFVDQATQKRFVMNHNTFLALVDALRDTRRSHAQILETFTERLASLSSSEDSIRPDFIEYDYLLLAHVLDFSGQPLMATKAVEGLFTLEQKVPPQFAFNFAHVCSLLGNILFKAEHFDQALKCKSAAFESVKGLGKLEISFPSYVRPIEPKNLIFDVFAFLFACRLHTGKLEQSQKLLEKLETLEPLPAFLDATRHLLHVAFSVAQRRPEEALESLEKAHELSSSLENNSHHRNILEATVDKLSLELAELRNDDTSKIKRLSEASLDKLYQK